MNIKASTSEELLPVRWQAICHPIPQFCDFDCDSDTEILGSRDPEFQLRATNCQREFHKFRLESTVGVSGNGPHRVHYAHKRWHFRHWTEAWRTEQLLLARLWLWRRRSKTHTEICPAISVRCPYQLPPKMIGAPVSPDDRATNFLVFLCHARNAGNSFV